MHCHSRLNPHQVREHARELARSLEIWGNTSASVLWRRAGRVASSAPEPEPELAGIACIMQKAAPRRCQRCWCCGAASHVAICVRACVRLCHIEARARRIIPNSAGIPLAGLVHWRSAGGCSVLLLLSSVSKARVLLPPFRETVFSRAHTQCTRRFVCGG